jgi:hypothetical protein
MARLYTFASSNDGIKQAITRRSQSAHINNLIGASASHPAIPIAGAVEQEIAVLFESNQGQEARKRMNLLHSNCEALKP